MKVSHYSRPIPVRRLGGVAAGVSASTTFVAPPPVSCGARRTAALCSRSRGAGRGLVVCGPGDGRRVALAGAFLLNPVSAGKYLRAHTLGPERW